MVDYLDVVAAHGPLALIVDDVHRADHETATLIARVAAECKHLLIVIAYRPDQSATLDATLADLAELRPTRIRLSGLDASDSAALVRRVSGTDPDSAILEALTERTGGNPFYLRESARLLASEGALVAVSDVPEGVRDVLRRRLARLPDLTVSILRLASVVGRDADVEVLTSAAEVDPDTVFDALESGVAAGLLDEPAVGTVRFAHAIVRDTLYSDLTRLRRSRWHARVGEAIERLRPHDYAALAHHFAEALSTTTARRALAYNLAAADHAASRYAHDGAIGFLHNAEAAADGLPGDDRATADEWIDIYTRTGRTQLVAGFGRDAMRTRNQALQVARTSGNPQLMIDTLTYSDTPTPWLNRRYGALDTEVVEQIESLLRIPDLDVDARCRLLVALVDEVIGEDHDRCTSAAREADKRARETNDVRLVGLASYALYTAGLHTSPTSGRSVGDELIEIGDGCDTPVFTMLGHHVKMNNAAGGGDVETARDHLEAGLALAHRYGWRQAQATGAIGRALLAHMTGDLDSAEMHYQRAHADLARAGLDADNVLALGLFTVRLTQGRMSELEPLIRTVDSDAPDAIADLLALVLHALGRDAEARSAREGLRPVRRDFFHSLFTGIRGIAICTLGEKSEAAATYRDLLPYSGLMAGADWGGFSVGPVDTILGGLADLLGHTDQAAQHYSTALTVAERCGCKEWIAAVHGSPTGLQVDH